MTTAEDRLYESRLHRTRPGEYRVGASPFMIVRHGKAWCVYHQTLYGLERVRGAWVFSSLRDARARAFDVVAEYYA